MPEELDCPLLPNYELALTGQPAVNPQKMAKVLMKIAMQKMKHKRPMSHRRKLQKQKWY